MIDASGLAMLPLFDGLQHSDLEVLAKNLRPLHIESGEQLVSEGVTTRGPLLVIIEGNVEVSQKDSQGQARTLALIESPTVIGEMEFLADIQSSATVTAHDDITGYLLPRQRFEALLESGEPAAYHLAVQIGRVVSERLASTNQALTKALAKDPEKMVKVQQARMTHDLAALDAELADILKS